MKYNILLVEDNDIDAFLCKTSIKRFFPVKFNLTHVSSLGGAISELNNEEQFHIVLLDLNIDDTRGITTLKTFKKYCKATPVIVLSSEGADSVIENSLEIGAVDYIIKGSNSPQELAENIFEIVSK